MTLRPLQERPQEGPVTGGGKRQMRQQSRSQATEENYAYRARLLRHQAAKALGIPANADLLPSDLVRHVIDRKPELATRSWRVYKAALTADIEAMRDLASAHNELLLVDDAEVALAWLSEEGADGTKRRSRQTSANKRKGFPKTLRDALFAYLDAHKGKHRYAGILKHWLHYSLLTGLRPCEWDAAAFVVHDGKPALRVENAKHTNGRGNGPYRTLLLHHLPEAELAGLQDWLGLLDAMQRDEGLSFAAIQLRLRKYLQRCTRIVAKQAGHRGKLPTLYSTRHQWSANMKKLARDKGWEARQVAALHGHAADDTASSHYGRRRSADEEVFVIEPVQEEAARVRPRFKTREFNWRKATSRQGDNE